MPRINFKFLSFKKEKKNKKKTTTKEKQTKTWEEFAYIKVVSAVEILRTPFSGYF